MPLSSPVSPRDLGLKEKRFQSLADAQKAYNLMVKRLNNVYKYNRRDHDRLTEDVEDVSGASSGSLTVEHHASGDTLLESESGSVHTNKGAGETIVLNLPSGAAEGTYFYFSIWHPYALHVNPGDNDLIRWSSGSADGAYIANNGAGNIGESLMIVADENSDWIVTSLNGDWSVET